MQQRSLWSSSEMAEHWQQDVERRRRDFTEATQRMLEAASLKLERAEALGYDHRAARSKRGQG